MEAPSMDTVYQAISALYDNPNVNEKEKASLWLGDVQKSIHSWKVADELLHQKKNFQACYFAAQTMRSKVQHNLSELPDDAVISLRDSLILHLESVSPDVNSAILTQLSLALADLALQMPTWQNCVSDLIKIFSNKNNFALLEILTVLPQEIDSSSLKLGDNRREQIKLDLRGNSPIVVIFLKDCINSSQTSNIALKIIRCMTSWTQVKAINLQELAQNPVVGLCVQVLRDYNTNNSLHEAATDCMCAILDCLEQNNNGDEVERMLFDSLSALEESYHLAVAHEEEEKAANLARLFTELGETFLERIIISTANGQGHFAIRSLELALVCVGHHDYEIAEITFNLWYRLSEEVYQRDYQQLTDAFKPHIERLIEALARHCQCEPDDQSLPEEGDEFYDFRVKVYELIKDVVFIVGSSSVFRKMFSVLQANLPWEQTEAALFIMQAVAKNILPREEYDFVPKVIEAILSMPEDSHLAVMNTCIQLLGELCDWIEKHPQCLEPCLRFLVRSLVQPKLANAAAVALQNICKACRSEASCHAALVVEAARAADQLALPIHTASTLMRALAAAISRLPHDQLCSAMRESVGVQLAGLSALLESNTELRKGSPTDPVLWLDRVAALFRDVDVAPPSDPTKGHPCMPAFKDAWPVLHRTMQKYVREGRVMERVCRCVRFCVRGTGRDAVELLPALATSLPPLYAIYQHSCLLYLTGVLADALGGPLSAPPLAHLLHALLPPALELLGKPDGLKDNPDTVDDLYRLCVRYLQRIPLQFVESGCCTAVVSCGVKAARLDHRDASCSLMSFLYDLLRLAHESDPATPLGSQINAIVSEYGEALTYALLEASALYLHAYMLSEVGKVLLELVDWQRRHGVDWVAAALPRLPRGRAHATEQQCWQFHQYAVKAEKCKEATRLLRDFARLYR
ncbi:transportin-3 isoform X1 [Pieris napi]|uniref:transportin-3 isoform X1 n=1 Tax=Pieris napi TaxID=78633 RepID=UPI001FBA4096|nr:transportin-3 isoform X1 [Pieris napi]